MRVREPVTASLRTREVRRVGLLSQRPHLLRETTSDRIRTAEPASVLLQLGATLFFGKKGNVCLLACCYPTSGIHMAHFFKEERNTKAT